MRVIVYDINKKDIDATPKVKYRELSKLLKESDIVSLHVPLNKNTYLMIDRDQIATMKPSSYLINTSRGKVVNEKALFEALKSNRIAGAGLDVYEDEPSLCTGLVDLTNVVLLPHIGSASIDTRNEMSRLAAVNALAFLKKEKAPNTINPEVYGSETYKKRIL